MGLWKSLFYRPGVPAEKGTKAGKRDTVAYLTSQNAKINAGPPTYSPAQLAARQRARAYRTSCVSSGSRLTLTDYWTLSALTSAASLRRLHRAIEENLPGQILPPCSGFLASAHIRSARTGTDVYSVSADGCTCQDFEKNQKPCKHMFALALHNHGYAELLEMLYSIPRAVTEKCIAIKDFDAFYQLCLPVSSCGDITPGFYPRTAAMERLVTGGAAVEVYNDGALLKKYTPKELSALIKIARPDVQVPSRKADQIAWVLENSKEIVHFCRLHYICAALDPKFACVVDFCMAYVGAANAYPFVLPEKSSIQIQI